MSLLILYIFFYYYFILSKTTIINLGILVHCPIIINILSFTKWFCSGFTTIQHSWDPTISDIPIEYTKYSVWGIRTMELLFLFWWFQAIWYSLSLHMQIFFAKYFKFAKKIFWSALFLKWKKEQCSLFLLTKLDSLIVCDGKSWSINFLLHSRMISLKSNTTLLNYMLLK